MKSVFFEDSDLMEIKGKVVVDFTGTWTEPVNILCPMELLYFSISYVFG